MNIYNTSSPANQQFALPLPTPQPVNPLLDNAAQNSESQVRAPDALREAFHDFVGQTFFAEMIKAFRSSQQPSEYFHGGRAEEIFQGQLDQVLSEELSNASADKIADPMYELFMLNRRA